MHEYELSNTIHNVNVRASSRARKLHSKFSSHLASKPVLIHSPQLGN